MSSSTSVELLNRLMRGDPDAAAAVFERYVERLTRLARSRLAAKLAARVDPEDIVLSAYRSFFVAAGQGRFEVHRGGDLWQLLVEVTLHKLYRSAEHHLAQRRSVERERRVADSSHTSMPFTDKEPTPDEAAAAADELEAVLQRLTERGRQVLELRLQGYEHEEIAERLNCNERTVRRQLSEARRLMAARGGSGFVPAAARKSPERSGPPRPRAKSAEVSALDAPFNWNDFILQEQIGAGATGKVYRARHKRNGGEVAIKFLRKSLIGNATAMARFLREAQTVKALAHPGIVAIRGAGRTPGNGLFLVMDLVRGTDLEKVRCQRTIAVDEAVRWVADAAHVVQFAHEHGVIHCDLKPSNLLLDEGRIRVTDFGLALRLLEPASESALLAGTPAFMAPEQVDPCWGLISPRTDVWGLGGVLYFLLFGQPPHTAGDVPSTLGSVVSKTPVRIPNDRAGRIPRAVLDIVNRCLAKRPRDRLTSADVLANMLSAISATG
jgi:eukaryotic-like serine/threonine-protein kinase